MSKMPAPTVLRWWPVLVPVVIVLVGAWFYRWVDEDAFINFRIIDNLLAGHGLVFNVGERVEVDSDPLWLFTLTVLHEIFPFVALEWLSVILGLVCTGGGFLAGGRADPASGAARGHRADRVPARSAGGLGGGRRMGVRHLRARDVDGLPVAGRLVPPAGAGRRPPAPGGAGGGGHGTRPTRSGRSWPWPRWSSWSRFSWWSPPPAGQGRQRRVVRYGAAARRRLWPSRSLFELFRMGYYALLVPNTGLAKAGAAAWWSQGFTYLWNFVAPYTLWLPLAAGGPLRASLPARALVAAGRPHRRGGAGHAGRGRAGRHPLRGARRRRLHARPTAPARVLRRLPSHLRRRIRQVRTVLVVPADRDRGVGGGLRRLAPVRPAEGDQPQSPDRVHLQRAQQLDQRHRQSAPDHRQRTTARRSPGSAGDAARPAWPHRVPAGHQRAAGHHQSVRADRPSGTPTGAVGAALHPGGQRARHRGHRLPGRPRRLHLRLVLAGQSHRQPHRDRQARPARPREVHRAGVDGGPLRRSPAWTHSATTGGPSTQDDRRSPHGAGL